MKGILPIKEKSKVPACCRVRKRIKDAEKGNNMRFIKFIKGKSIEGLLTLVSLLLAVVIFNWPILGWETVKGVAFLNGKAVVIYSDSANPDERDTYLINLIKGQGFKIDVKWPGANVETEGEKLPGYTIIFPDGKKIADTANGYLLAE